MNEKILEKINETIGWDCSSFNERIADAFDYLEKKKKITIANKFLYNILNDVDILRNCLHCSLLSILYNNEEDKIILLILCAFNIVNVDEELDNPNSLYKGTHLSTSVKDKFFKFVEETNLTPITFQEVDSISKSFDNPPEEFDNPPEEFDNPPVEEINNKGDKGEKYEFVNHPQHYNEWSMEVIDMMEKIYGIENTIMWCEMTAYKYAMRMGFKPTDDIQQEIDKRNWYLNKAKELKQKLN